MFHIGTDIGKPVTDVGYLCGDDGGDVDPRKPMSVTYVGGSCVTSVPTSVNDQLMSVTDVGSVGPYIHLHQPMSVTYVGGSCLTSFPTSVNHQQMSVTDVGRVGPYIHLHQPMSVTYVRAWWSTPVPASVPRQPMSVPIWWCRWRHMGARAGGFLHMLNRHCHLTGGEGE